MSETEQFSLKTMSNHSSSSLGTPGSDVRKEMATRGSCGEGDGRMKIKHPGAWGVKNTMVGGSALPAQSKPHCLRIHHRNRTQRPMVGKMLRFQELSGGFGSLLPSGVRD